MRLQITGACAFRPAGIDLSGRSAISADCDFRFFLSENPHESEKGEPEAAAPSIARAPTPAEVRGVLGYFLRHRYQDIPAAYGGSSRSAKSTRPSSAAHWRRAWSKVSGRKIPFPRLLFATVSTAPDFKWPVGLKLDGKYPPAKPGALGCEPLKAVGRVADATRELRAA